MAEIVFETASSRWTVDTDKKSWKRTPLTNQDAATHPFDYDSNGFGDYHTSNVAVALVGERVNFIPEFINSQSGWISSGSVVRFVSR